MRWMQGKGGGEGGSRVRCQLKNQIVEGRRKFRIKDKKSKVVLEVTIRVDFSK